MYRRNQLKNMNIKDWLDYKLKSAYIEWTIGSISYHESIKRMTEDDNKFCSIG